MAFAQLTFRESLRDVGRVCGAERQSVFYGRECAGIKGQATRLLFAASTDVPATRIR
jgi:hypothetical protein